MGEEPPVETSPVRRSLLKLGAVLLVVLVVWTVCTFAILGLLGRFLRAIIDPILGF